MDIELIQIILLLLCGFSVLMRLVVHSVERSRLVAVIPVVSILYICFVGFFFLIALVLASWGDALLALLIMTSLASLVFSLRALKNNWEYINKLFLILFILYFLAVLFMTIFNRGDTLRHDIQMDTFEAIREAIKEGSFEPMGHFLLNILLFVPVGFLFVLIDPEELDSVFWAVPCGLMLSTIIESTQMIFFLGQCDTGDILANTLGAMVGVLISKLIVYGIL